MALSPLVTVSGTVEDSASVVTVSAKGGWRTALLDSKGGTVQTAGQLIRPLSTTGSNVVPLRLGSKVTRIMVRGAYNADCTSINHAGKVWVYGVYGDPTVTAGVPAWTDTGTGTTVVTPRVIRLDLASTSQSLTAVSSTDYGDASWKYTAPLTVDGSPMIDTLGCQYVMVLLETQSDVSGGTTAAAFVEVCAF